MALAAGVLASTALVPRAVLTWSGAAPPAASSMPASASPSTAAPGSTSSATPRVTLGPNATATVVTVTRAVTQVAPRFTPIRVAAADPRNTGYGTRTIRCIPCASGSRVQYLGQGHVLVVPVRGVPVAGRRTLTIAYQTVGARSLYLDVNGTDQQVLTLQGLDSWELPAYVKVPVTLVAGDNQLRFYNSHDPAPDLDQLTIS